MEFNQTNLNEGNVNNTYAPKRPKPKTGAKVFLGIPTYLHAADNCYVADAYEYAVDPKGENQYVKNFCQGSFLARSFNTLWCNALNTRRRGFTHFAMLHQDVAPKGQWLDTLLQEMQANGADLLSVVLPIKTYHGLTSTAIYHKETGRIRRLTMREIHHSSRPKTFDAESAGYPDWLLLPSTGCWICRFTDPWVEKVWFEVRDKIIRKEDGTFHPETGTDDWLFAMKLHQEGLRLMSTTAVTAGHWGPQEFRNDVAWGSVETDTQTSKFSDDWLREEGF